MSAQRITIISLSGVKKTKGWSRQLNEEEMADGPEFDFLSCFYSRRNKG